MSIPTEKRLANELYEIYINVSSETKSLGNAAVWKKQAQLVRKLMKAHGAAMFKKGQIS